MRIFEAVLTDGKVYINDDIIVPDARILSQGQGDSTGILLIQGSECIYIAETAGDLKDGLQIIADGFGTLAGDVKQATGGLSDVGGATATFQTDMENVKIQLEKLIKALK